MGNKKKDQRANIKFCIANGFSAENTFDYLKKSHPTDHYSLRNVYRWYRYFNKEGRTSLIDRSRCGAPVKKRTQENIDRVQELILNDRRLTVDIISDELNLSKTIVHRILTENLKMKRVASKVVPRILSDEQKKKRLDNSKEMLLKIQKNPEFLKRVITGDESWVYGYDPETKQMSSQWLTSTEQPPKKAKSQKSAVKCMLILFF